MQKKLQDASFSKRRHALRARLWETAEYTAKMGKRGMFMHPTINRIFVCLSALLLGVCLLILWSPYAGALENSTLLILVSTGEEEGNIPLANIILDVYRADSQSPKNTVQRRDLLATLVTDKRGQARLNTAGMPEELLVVVQDNPVILGGDTEVLFSLSNGEDSLHLMLIPEKSPNLQMDIESLGQKSGTADLEQLHEWVIRCDMPAGICSAREFTVTDRMDYRLSYERDSINLVLRNNDGTELPLEKRHYSLKEEVQTHNGIPADQFQVALTPEGMTYVAANMEKGKTQLLIRFQAALNRNTSIGAAVPNDAHLTYINSAGITYYADSDIPEIHTAGLRIQKVSPAGKPLSGCTFMLAREATQTELEDESIGKEILHVGSQNLAVVYVDFYTEKSLEEKTYLAETDSNGMAAVYGLACGRYYLVECAEPERADMAVPPLEIEITQDSHLPENRIQITNGRFPFPNTGGTGTAALSAAGFLLICAACLLLASNRSRRY